MEHTVPSLLRNASGQHTRHLLLKDLRQFLKQKSNSKVKLLGQNKAKSKNQK